MYDFEANKESMNETINQSLGESGAWRGSWVRRAPLFSDEIVHFDS